MNVMEARNHVRQYYFNTGFFTQDEEEALEFVWNYPFSFMALEQNIGDKYSTINGDVFDAGFFTRIGSGSIDIGFLVRSYELVDQFNELFGNYDNALEKFYEKINDTEDFSTFKPSSDINEIKEKIIDIGEMSFIEASGGLWSALGRSYLEVSDRTLDTLPLAIELGDVVLQKLAIAKAGLEAFNVSSDFDWSSVDLSEFGDRIDDFKLFTIDMFKAGGHFANFITGENGDLEDLLPFAEFLSKVVPDDPFFTHLGIAGFSLNFINAAQSLKKASDYRDLVSSDSSNANEVLSFMEKRFLSDAFFNAADGVRKLASYLDGQGVSNPAKELADVFFESIELIVDQNFKDQYDLYYAKSNILGQLYYEYEKLANSYFDLDSALLNHIGETRIGEDGPIQFGTGVLTGINNSALGQVAIEAPTFTADGDVDFTVSLAGVGRGLQYNIAYIIDVSGSMSGTRIADAKSAYIQLTNQLIDLGIADVATFAVIPFHSSATSYAPLTAEQAIARISSLNASGGTSFGPALTAAGNFFSSATTGQTNVAYFLSDGQGTGASDALTNIANVQAFGIGTGVNLSSLNIIDSDDAVLLSSSSQLLNVLAGSSVDATKIDRIEITLNGNILETIASDQLTNGPLGLQFTGKISGLDVTQGAKNQISAIVYLTDGTQSGIAELSIASALNDTSVITNGTTSEIKFGALNTTFDADLIGATTVNLLGNNLDNTIKAFNVGGTFSSFDGNDTFLLGNYPNSTDRVIDGGDGFDVVVYTGNFIQSLVNKVGNIIKIGTNTDTLSNIEKVRFDDAILDTETFKVSYLNSSPIIGTSSSDYLVGTDKADMIHSLGGSYDRSAGGLGADIFVFGSEALNGVRERDVILDYEVGIDAIMLTDGATVGSIRQTSTGAVIFLEGDLDAIYVNGVLPQAITFV